MTDKKEPQKEIEVANQQVEKTARPLTPVQKIEEYLSRYEVDVRRLIQVPSSICREAE